MAPRHGRRKGNKNPWDRRGFCIGTGRVQADESYLGCHIHVDTFDFFRVYYELIKREPKIRGYIRHGRRKGNKNPRV
jgi:hypothetical protein